MIYWTGSTLLTLSNMDTSNASYNFFEGIVELRVRRFSWED